MPMYHFRCPHGHEFERVVPMADRNNPVPCEGMVPMLLNDEEVELLEGGGADPEFIDSVRMESVGPGGEEEGVWVRDVPCILKASMEIAHSNPSALTYRNLGANRDAAREGRYDPLNPSRRFMTK